MEWVEIILNSNFIAKSIDDEDTNFYCPTKQLPTNITKSRDFYKGI